MSTSACAASDLAKPLLSASQIVKMNVDFLGLQQANMSPIYAYLGADYASIPLLTLAGPVTGLLVQPIIGVMSDRTLSRYGRANRIWVMDRGISTEASLAQMRAVGASYLVGTPKGRLTRLEQHFVEQPWTAVREGPRVKRLGAQQDVYVLAESAARVHKERAMRRKRLGRYVQRLQALQGQTLTRDKLLMKLGAARHDAGRVASAIKLTVPEPAQGGGQHDQLRVQAGSRHAAPHPRPRRALRAAYQPRRRATRAAVALLHPAH